MKNIRTTSLSSTSMEKTNISIIEKENKPYYYGSIKKISSNNDISFINRGSVYFLKDNPKDINSKYHPYLVIQQSYLDKIGKIAVFGITSTPSSINMIPIIMKDAIGYIDPHQPYVYKISEFFELGTRYVGTIVNTKVIDLAVNFYGLYLGMNLSKTEDEIIQEYLDYVNEFRERSKNYKPYKHKFLEENDMSDLELQISFKSAEVINNQESSILIDDNDVKLSDDYEINDNDEIKENNTSDDSKTIEIDCSSQVMMAALSMMEEQPNGTLKLPSNIKNMLVDDIRLFFMYIKHHTQQEASELYGCVKSTISYKKKQLENMYNIVYI